MSGCVKWGKDGAKVDQALTRFKELITNDSKVRRQAVAYRKNASDAVRGARAHTTKVKIPGVDRKAKIVE